MLTIRLQRVGKKNDPRFRVVLTEHTSPVKSGEIEILGHFNPGNKENPMELKEERVKHWLSKGVQTSQTMRDWFVKKGLMEKVELKFAKKNPKKRKLKEGEEEAPKDAGAKPEEKPAEEKKPEAEAKPEPKKEEAKPEEKKPAPEPKKEEAKPAEEPKK